MSEFFWASGKDQEGIKALFNNARNTLPSTKQLPKKAKTVEGNHKESCNAAIAHNKEEATLTFKN